MFNPVLCHVGQMNFVLSDALGIIGVVFVLWAYLWLQLDKLSQDGMTYSLTNFLSSILLILSLLHTWNLASFIIEITWLAISGYGIFKVIKRKKAAATFTSFAK